MGSSHVLEMPKTTEGAAPEPWVDMATLAKHLGFSYQKTAKLVKEGQIRSGHPFPCGKKTYWKFKLSAVDAEMDARFTTVARLEAGE